MSDEIINGYRNGVFYGHALYDLTLEETITFQQILTAHKKFLAGELNGAPGPQGPEGPMGPIGPAGLIWKGAYNLATAYVKDNAIGFEGASYFCLAPTTGVSPSEDTAGTAWALLASQGIRGPTGPEGPQGLQGVQGVKGDKGDASEVVFDVSKLTPVQLEELYNKLIPFHPMKTWSSKVIFEKPINTSLEKSIQLWNLPFFLRFKTVDAYSFNIYAYGDNTSSFDVKKFGEYDAGGLDCYTFVDAFKSPTPAVLDALVYNGSREFHRWDIVDRATNRWYTLSMYTTGTLLASSVTPVEIRLFLEDNS